MITQGLIDSQTRGTSPVTPEEATIENLWMLAYPAGGDISTNLPSLALDIKYNKKGGTSPEITGTNEEYGTYTVTGLQNGDYHIYLLANVIGGEDFEGYGKDFPSDVNNLLESQLQQMILEFSSEKSLKPGRLPMACYFTDLKSGSSRDESKQLENGVYKFSSSSKPLYAKLSMLCCKVRYTILFDSSPGKDGEKEGFSQDFGDETVDFLTETGNTKAFNLSCQTAYREANISNMSYYDLNDLELRRVEYPDAESPYLDITNRQGEEGAYLQDLTPLADGTDWSNASRQRAWQGTAYLPENLSDQKSYITFTPTPESPLDVEACKMELYFNNKGIERGNSYNIVAKVKQPEVLTPVEEGKMFYLKVESTQQLKNFKYAKIWSQKDEEPEGFTYTTGQTLFFSYYIKDNETTHINYRLAVNSSGDNATKIYTLTVNDCELNGIYENYAYTVTSL
ncbi:MAG: hypothetical protein J1F38_00410 [Muribaculaceae bacterium]|nr:hypothetical protein [Muribaculaceae bacterium]